MVNVDYTFISEELLVQIVGGLLQ
jgi:tubulin-specific chaperone D